MHRDDKTDDFVSYRTEANRITATPNLSLLAQPSESEAFSKSVDRALSDWLSGGLADANSSDASVIEPSSGVLEIDLHLVSRINSMGLNSLISVQTLARHAGVRLELSGVCTEVREVFRITRLERMFEIVPSDVNAGLQPA
ncbi:hypothetical protein SV7mr_43590 [Stieleria bergensis]|uniref:STAS domain-containing protein n=1 Tax=Stieleria bergensis TaxID=2528025 RepID=A0A517T097_9BACT|nr:hypothetical protein SV7mr_43590 [Planctomycetes bacterium SV_7m_r]